tara:strand:+ start:461 stop:712 length:252 start_codon:yes stop_codon:yes gene_type:complete
MKDLKIKNLFATFSAAIFVLVLTGFGANRNYNNQRINQLCFKYAAKKCNFSDKDKARLICNTLISHNSNISGIKHHKECRKDM